MLCYEKRRAFARRFFSTRRSAQGSGRVSVLLCCCCCRAVRSRGRRHRTSSSWAPTTSDRWPHCSRAPKSAASQVVYSWKSLEKAAKDQYDFSQIEHDLALSRIACNRKLFIQIQDRFFEVQHRNVPAYLLSGARLPRRPGRAVGQPGENLPEGHGWVAQQWNPAVRERFQKLAGGTRAEDSMAACGESICRRAPLDIDMKNDQTADSPATDISTATLENIAHARKAFRKSHVVQYTNFWPCEWDNDREIHSRDFSRSRRGSDIGLGGPDIVPNRKGQMKNSYPFFNRYKDKCAWWQWRCRNRR